MQLPDARLDTFSGDAIPDLLLNVALGQIPDARTIFIVGHNLDITGGATEILWPYGGTIATIGVFPLNPVTCYVSSSSISDVGMTVRLSCIDTNWNMVDIGVTLNGRTAVQLPVQVRRVSKMVNVGTTATIGEVYAGTEAVPVVGVPAIGNTLNMISAADQNSHGAFYTVPLGYTAFITEFGGGTPTNDALTISGYFSNPESKVYQNGMHVAAYRSHKTQLVPYVPVPEKSDIYIAGTALTNNVYATGVLTGILLPNHYLKA